MTRQLEAVKVPNSFVVVGLLPLSAKLPEEIATLAPGERAGLPTMASRSFASPYEPDPWLAHTAEGALITKHASVIFIAAVTDYSRV